MSMRRQELWTVIAIILLAVGTVVALTRQQHVVNHVRDLTAANIAVDQKACELSLANRRALDQNIRALTDDPALAQSTKDDLAKQDTAIHRLIKELNGCRD